MVLGALGVALALALGGLVAFALVRGHSTTGDRLAVRSRSIDNGLTLLGDPQHEWNLRAGALLPHATFAPVAGWNDSELPTPDLLPIGPDFLAAVTNATNGRLVAVDSLTGRTVWTHDLGGDRENGGGTAACWSIRSDRLVCADGAGTELLDPATGSVVATTPDQLTFDTPVRYDATTLYAVIDVPGSQRHQLAAYSLADLSRTAATDLPGSAGWDLYDNAVDLGVADGRLTLLVGDYPRHRVIEASVPDLAILSDTVDQVSQESTEDGWRITDDDAESDTTTVSRNGVVALSAAGTAWSTLYDPTAVVPYGSIVNGRIGVGNSLYDLGTGQVLWSRDDLEGNTPQLTADGAQALLTSGSSDYSSGSTSAIDTSDGSTSWTVDTAFYPAFTTRDAIVSVESASDGSNARLTVRRRTSGDAVWSRDVSSLGASDGSLSAPVVAGQGVAVVATGRMRGWTGFPQAPTSGPAGDGSTTTPTDGGTSYVTDCGSPPTFTPVRSASEYGGISVTYRVTAVCPGGQWLGDSQLSVPLEVDGSNDLSGWFDFSAEPYWIPADGVDLTLTYPFENATAPQRQIQEAIDDAAAGGGTVIRVPCTPGPSNDVGTVPADPSYGKDPTVPTTADGDPDATTTQQAEDNALAALKRIAAQDEPAVRELDWTAQLSAKKLGTQDDGIVYASYSDILALHLRLRSRYPDALLVFSSDWPGSYGPSSAGFWVTLSGDSRPTAPAVNRWCRSQRRGPGDCWAKRLATSGDPAVNTVHRKPGQ